MLQLKRPEKIREYTGHPIIDSTRWRVYNPRPDDIIISTSYKAGTTWTQTIVANLLFQDGNFPAPVSVMGPWLDMQIMPLEETAAGLEAQTHRRYIKTHLALDGLPFFDEVKYVVVGRDARDVFMSLWNHHSNYSDEILHEMRTYCEGIGVDYPAEYKNLSELWQAWINRGWFDWETDGFPYWSHLHHIQSWWDYRHMPNICFVHFADLLRDPEGEIRRLANYLEIELDEDELPGILQRISFGGMKKNFTNIMPEADMIWRGGGKTFMNKGTNGRWRDVLSEADLKLYGAAVARELTSDCAEWLEHGGPVLT